LGGARAPAPGPEEVESSLPGGSGGIQNVEIGAGCLHSKGHLMPGMMRRQDKALSPQMAETLLESGEYGILSTVGQDGYPYGVPISYAYVDGAIYIHSATEGRKVTNLHSNAKVSFCVIGFSQVQPHDFTVSFATAIASGRAHRVDGEKKRKALEAIAAKYTDRSPKDIDDFIASEGEKTAVFRIDVESLTAKGDLLMAKDKFPSDVEP